MRLGSRVCQPVTILVAYVTLLAKNSTSYRYDGKYDKQKKMQLQQSLGKDLLSGEVGGGLLPERFFKFEVFFQLHRGEWDLKQHTT